MRRDPDPIAGLLEGGAARDVDNAEGVHRHLLNLSLCVAESGAPSIELDGVPLARRADLPGLPGSIAASSLGAAR